MDRERKTTGTPREQPGKPIGARHLEDQSKERKPEGRLRTDIGRAMDAVREVVERDRVRRTPEKHVGAGSSPAEPGRRAMDAVREVVRKEK